MATSSTTTNSTTAEKMDASSTPPEPSLTSSIKTSTISATVQPTSTGFTMPIEAQITKTEPETTPDTHLSTSIASEEPTTTEKMAAGSTPADPSLTNSIDIVITSATVLPTSTGFTMFFEPPTAPAPSPSPPPPPPTTVEPETTPSISLSTRIPAAEPTITEKMAAGNTPADPSLTNSIDIVITSATVQPTSTGFTMFFEPPPPPPPSPSKPPPQTTTVEPENSLRTSLSTSIPAEEPTRRDTKNPATSITSRSPQATTSDGSSRRKTSLMDSLISRPRDWGFNVFLDGLAAEITNEELKRLKLYFIGENGIGSGTLEKIETALELFTILRRRNILTRDNIIYLQAMLWHLKRQDLHRKCVEHARNFGTATYFYAPSPEPENGYRYVRFHVESNELIDFDRDKLEYIRRVVAELLLVPPEFVLVSGLEPSASLIITFMIPEYYATLLIEMVVDYRTPQLLDVGIDKIYYDGKLYHLLGKGSNESILGNFRGKLEDREELLERLQRAETWLDQRETEVIELSRLLDKAKRNLQKVREEKAEKECVQGVSDRTCSLIRSKAKGESKHDIRKLKINILDLPFQMIRTKFRNGMSKSVPGEKVIRGSVPSKLCLRIGQGLAGLFFFIYYFIWCSAYLAPEL